MLEIDAVHSEIVVAADAAPAVRFAGMELNRILSRALGGLLPVVPEPSGQRTPIILGAGWSCCELYLVS